MAKVVTADIFNCYSSINTFVFCLKFDLSLFLTSAVVDNSPFIQMMVWRRSGHNPFSKAI